MDKNVYESERHAVGRCSDSLVIVANKGIFGDGVFSMKGGVTARMIGQKLVRPYHIRIAKPKGTVLFPDGVRRNGTTQPYMPKSLDAEFHPGGNSLCYTIQTAHLMGCDPIYLMGFTLKSGSSYFWGNSTNPILKRPSIYDEARALHWLAWYEEQWPGRAQLVEGWDGPVYDVFKTVTCDELKERFQVGSPKTSEWIV